MFGLLALDAQGRFGEAAQCVGLAVLFCVVSHATRTSRHTRGAEFDATDRASAIGERGRDLMAHRLVPSTEEKITDRERQDLARSEQPESPQILASHHEPGRHGNDREARGRAGRAAALDAGQQLGRSGRVYVDELESAGRPRDESVAVRRPVVVAKLSEHEGRIFSGARAEDREEDQLILKIFVQFRLRPTINVV